MQRVLGIVAAAGMAVAMLAACSGGKSSSSSSTTTTTNASPAASPSAAAASPAASASSMNGAMKSAASGPASAGAKVFSTNCASCHQANGQGQPGVFPPLAGNTVVTGAPTAVIHIVKNGLNGKISVKGSTYNGQMPPWKGVLKDSDIAAVVSYIRSAWGNHAGAVTAAQVTATK